MAGFYHDTLKTSPDALAYLKKRGLTDPEVIERFRLGFANRTLGYRLPASNRNSGAEMRGRLQALGILRESGHEHFNGSLVIPIVTPAGDVVQMYGRKITENLRAGTPLHLYLPGPHRGVWNEEALEASKEIILCEALIDALTFWCAGYRNVISSYGINGFTDDHRAALKKHGTRRVLIAYDRDEAGEKAAQTLADELMAGGLECFRILFPRGMNANEYALKVTPAAKSLGMLINKAQWLGKGAQIPERETVEVAVSEEPEAAAKEEPTTEAEPVFPLAAAPAVIDVPAEIKVEEIVITFGDRRWRIRGLAKNLSYYLLKVNVLASRDFAGSEPGFHGKRWSRRNRSPRWRAKTRRRRWETFYATAMRRMEVATLELLRDPRLLDRILEDFARCGVVGEETNKLTGYIAVVSRHLEAPVAVIVQSSSAAGKSSLMEAILEAVRHRRRPRDADGAAGQGKEGPAHSDRRAGAGMDRQVHSRGSPGTARASDDGTVFLTHLGEPFERMQLTALVRRYVGAAKIGKMGGCHLWRHTVATMMLENGADIRVIQELLGHAKIATTELYTRVSINLLKQVYAATHPGAHLNRAALPEKARDAEAEAELLSLLAAEAAEEDGD